MEDTPINHKNAHRTFVTEKLKPYWKRLLFAFLCTLILGILSAIVACLIGPCIQVVSSNSNRTYLLSDLIGKNLSFLSTPFIKTTSFQAQDLMTFLPILLSLLGGLKCICAITQGYIWENTCEQIAKNIRSTLIKKYLSTSGVRRTTQSISAIENQLSSIITTDIKLTKEYLAHFYGGFPREMAQIFFMIITLLLLSKQLTLIFIFCLLPTFFVITKLGKKLHSKSTEALFENSKLSEWLQQRFLGIETIKLYNTEEIETKKMTHLTQLLYQKLVRSEKIKARSGPLLEMVAILAMIIILFLAFKAIQNETLTGSIATSFFATIAILSQSAQKMGRYFNQKKEGTAAIGRICQALNIIETKQEPPLSPIVFLKKSQKEILSCQNLSVHFSGEKIAALSNFSYSFLQGKTYCLYGPSGSGKSTLIKTLLGLIQPDSGKISYYEPIKKLADIGYVPQNIQLGHLSILENITYPSFNIDSIRAEETLHNVGLSLLPSKLPQGIHTLMGDYNKIKLSGGQNQRIALARIFYHQFPLVLIDEGFSALDVEGESFIYSNLKKLQKETNITIIFVSHRVSSLDFSDESIYLETV